MNLSGVPRYSNSISALKAPSSSVNQQFKLVYVFPMLFDDSLGKYQELFREFMSKNVLKEIFVSNTIHLLSYASQYDYTPDASATINGGLGGNITINLGQQNQQQNQQPQPAANRVGKYEVQMKLQEKIERLKRVLLIDPNIKKLSPVIDMITLDNFIDVPVIVGTKNYTTPTIDIFYILLTAIAKGIPLKSAENLDKIILALDRITDKNLYTLFDNIKKADPVQSPRWLVRLLFSTNKNTISPAQLKQLGSKPGFFGTTKASDINKDNPLRALKLKKNQLDDLSLKFKFMLNKNLLYNQCGLKFDNTITSTIRSINPHLTSLLEEMFVNFITTVGVSVNPLLHVITTLLYPTGMINVSYASGKETNIDVALNNDLNTLKKDMIPDRLETSLSGMNLSSSDADRKFNTIEKLCKSSLPYIQDIHQTLFKRLQDITSNFRRQMDDASYRDFIKELDEIGSSCQSYNKSLEQIIKNIIDNPDQIFTAVWDSCITHVQNLFEHFISFITPNNPAFAVNSGFFGANNVNKFASDISVIVTNYVNFVFLVKLTESICQYAQIAKVTIADSKSDVLDYPNYTLVVSLDTILMLHAAFVSKRWEDLISQNLNISEVSPAENYIKGMVKLVNKQLGIPNLFVVDEKKGDVYYKIMYLEGINKTKLSTLETFVKSFDL